MTKHPAVSARRTLQFSSKGRHGVEASRDSSPRPEGKHGDRGAMPFSYSSSQPGHHAAAILQDILANGPDSVFRPQDQELVHASIGLLDKPSVFVGSQPMAHSRCTCVACQRWLASFHWCRHRHKKGQRKLGPVPTHRHGISVCSVSTHICPPFLGNHFLHHLFLC